ncbi:unnamed protein product [Zymoseptoria tritici ST99CH_1E4]|uniref:Mediator of RNA polymerase II transcription subunit 1 n=2 Tax=Zymoseptoria tritici TaxID=1047171 RepID=A0A2H1FJH1_ZYMTR|nr:unnamed protein product [Zymoseptoria tritici ST99CH_1E4]
MSTPTSTSALPQPTSASKKSAHSTNAAVTTPSTLGVSPAPRSVPSPAATRHTAKTPTSKNATGGTPMVAGLSQSGMSFSSPAGGTGPAPGGQGGIGTGLSMGSFGGTPNMGGLGGLGLGLEMGGTPGHGMSGQTPVGGVGMIPTMSELGLTISGGKRNEDEERRERMRRVLRSIGRAKGSVSEDGIVRIAKRIGLDNDIDKAPLTAEERARVVGNRTIALAGATSIIEVKMKNHRAEGVEVTFAMGEKEWETRGAKRVGKVLLEDLRAGDDDDGALIRSRLDAFAANLVRLARIDQISDGTGQGINCFEAIDGVHVCLSKLFEKEKEAVGGEGRKAERDTMCKRSGRPALHENGRIGMSLDYWTSSPLPPSAAENDDSRMDVDGQEGSDSDSEGPKPKLWSLRIDAGICSAAMFPSLRVSEDWLPSDLSLPSPSDLDQSLPWQDPPPTYITVKPNADSQAADSMALDGSQKLPDLRFVARLDPPLIVPYQTATNILASLGLSPPQTLLFQHFHALLLDLPTNALQAGFAETIEAEQSIFVPNGEDGEDGEDETRHQYLLDVAKPEWGLKLEELPFSHPRQLVDLLPTFRQWARVADLMNGCFGGNSASATAGLNAATFSSAMSLTDSGVGLEPDPDAMDLDDLLNSPAPPSPTPDPTPATATRPDERSAKVDCTTVSVELATSPHPSISFAFPLHDREKTAVVEVQVGINGNLEIGGCEVLAKGSGDEEEGAKGSLGEEKVKAAKALERCGDVGVWVEWLRGRMGN